MAKRLTSSLSLINFCSYDRSRERETKVIKAQKNCGLGIYIVVPQNIAINIGISYLFLHSHNICSMLSCLQRSSRICTSSNPSRHCWNMLLLISHQFTINTYKCHPTSCYSVCVTLWLHQLNHYLWIAPWPNWVNVGVKRFELCPGTHVFGWEGWYWFGVGRRDVGFLLTGGVTVGTGGDGEPRGRACLASSAMLKSSEISPEIYI